MEDEICLCHFILCYPKF